jgi:5-methylcytosine-specific restriction protein A
MPRMPPTLGSRPREERRRDYEAERRKAKPWRKWYSLAVWKARRAEQLRRQPLCELCMAAGKVTEATVADHDPPHRGVWELFIAGSLESLCKRCHDSVKQREERQAAR